MKMKILVISLAAIAAIGAVVAIATPQIRFTVHVVGEDNSPLEGVEASFIFHPEALRQNHITQVDVVSDADGNFTVQGPSQDGTFGVGNALIHQNGYYPSGVNIPNFTKTDDLGHWLPWDATYTTVMRKIENPIPMYAKTIEINIPAVGIPCGYDLMAGDWVGPYGKGRKADLIFTLQRQWQDVYHFDVSVAVTFSNSGDGIILTNLPKEFANSQFKWPRMAPETGYTSSLSLKSSANQIGYDTNFQTNVASEQDYFFRVRTTELNGKVSSALYGKIAGGMILRPGASKTCKIHLAYYLNPTSNDQNMEYGGTLFKNLPDLEVPRAP
jgi:hypothetical protein